MHRESHYASVDQRQPLKKRPRPGLRVSHAESIMSMSIRDWLPPRIDSSLDQFGEATIRHNTGQVKTASHTTSRQQGYQTEKDTAAGFTNQQTGRLTGEEKQSRGESSLVVGKRRNRIIFTSNPVSDSRNMGAEGLTTGAQTPSLNQLRSSLDQIASQKMADQKNSSQFALRNFKSTEATLAPSQVPKLKINETTNNASLAELDVPLNAIRHCDSLSSLEKQLNASPRKGSLSQDIGNHDKHDMENHHDKKLQSQIDSLVDRKASLEKSEDQDGPPEPTGFSSLPPDEPEGIQSMANTGEIKDEHGQVIQRHIVNFDNLQMSRPHRKHIFDEPEKQKKGKSISVGFGFEFQSFSQLRQKVHKETDQARADLNKAPARDRKNLVGTLRKSSQNLIGSMMQKVVADRLRDYYSVPVSNGSVAKIPIVQEGTATPNVLSSFAPHAVLDEQCDAEGSRTQSGTAQTSTQHRSSLSKESQAFQSIRDSCESAQGRYNHIAKIRANTFAAQKYWRTSTIAQFDNDLNSLRKKLKLTNASNIDFVRYKNDIVERKEMLKQLNDDARRLKESLRTTNHLKDKAVNRLDDAQQRYFSLILVNIITIQRWWKGIQSRIFFKSVVRKQLKIEKDSNKAQIEDMQKTIQEQESAMILKMQYIEEQSQRDKNKELMDQKMSEMYQEKKSKAIIKFETAMSKMISKAAKKSTLTTLKDVKGAIFNKKYEHLIDQLSSYYQKEMKTPAESQTTGDGSSVARKRSSRLTFAPTMAERISLDAAQGYNTEAQQVQTVKSLIEQEKKQETLSRLNTISKRPTLILGSLLKTSKTTIVNDSEEDSDLTPSPKKTEKASFLIRTNTSVREYSSGGRDIFATFQSRSLALKGDLKSAEDNDFTSMTGAQPVFAPTSLLKQALQVAKNQNGKRIQEVNPSKNTKCISPTLRRTFDADEKFKNLLNNTRRNSIKGGLKIKSSSPPGSPNSLLRSSFSLMNPGPMMMRRQISTNQQRKKGAILEPIKERIGSDTQFREDSSSWSVSGRTLLAKQLSQHSNSPQLSKMPYAPAAGLKPNYTVKQHQPAAQSPRSIKSRLKDKMSSRTRKKSKSSLSVDKGRIVHQAKTKHRKAVLPYAIQQQTNSGKSSKNSKMAASKWGFSRTPALSKNTSINSAAGSSESGEVRIFEVKLNPCAGTHQMSVKKDGISKKGKKLITNSKLMQSLKLERVKEDRKGEAMCSDLKVKGLVTSSRTNQNSNVSSKFEEEYCVDSDDSSSSDKRKGGEDLETLKGGPSIVISNAASNRYISVHSLKSRLQDAVGGESIDQGVFLTTNDAGFFDFDEQDNTDQREEAVSTQALQVANADDKSTKEQGKSSHLRLPPFAKPRFSNADLRTGELQFSAFDEQNPLQPVQKTKSTEDLVAALKPESYRYASVAGSKRGRAKKAEFQEEQDRLVQGKLQKVADQEGLGPSDLSSATKYGSFMDERRQKYISPEQTEYIRSLVAKSVGRAENQMQTYSKPFCEAYSELDDLSRLFDKRGAYWRAAVVEHKEKIAARITQKQIDLLKEREGAGEDKKLSNLHLTFLQLLAQPDPDKSSPKKTKANLSTPKQSGTPKTDSRRQKNAPKDRSMIGQSSFASKKLPSPQAAPHVSDVDVSSSQGSVSGGHASAQNELDDSKSRQLGVKTGGSSSIAQVDQVRFYKTKFKPRGVPEVIPEAKSGGHPASSRTSYAVLRSDPGAGTGRGSLIHVASSNVSKLMSQETSSLSGAGDDIVVPAARLDEDSM